MKKITVAVIFGGTNTEHEVSIASAQSIINNLDREKYKILPVLISKNNQWLTSQKVLNTSTPIKFLPEVIDKTSFKNPHQIIAGHKIDIIFPVIHGPFGEDGTLQGLLELLHIPYVGSKVLGSAICMDKDIQKRLCLQANISVPNYQVLKRNEYSENSHGIKKIANELGYPLFIKPANQGSSVGVSKVLNESDLKEALAQAFSLDTKVLIESAIQNTRELECSVLGNNDPQASLVGEIISSNDFYDYDAKYIDGKSKSIIPAMISKKLSQKIKKYAIKSFKTLECNGLARVDFLLNDNTQEIYVNELNTMPGFTDISMFPKLWEASGLPYAMLLDRLIDLAFEKFNEQELLTKTFKPKTLWHRQ